MHPFTAPTARCRRSRRHRGVAPFVVVVVEARAMVVVASSSICCRRKTVRWPRARARNTTRHTIVHLCTKTHTTTLFAITQAKSIVCSITNTNDADVASPIRRGHRTLNHQHHHQRVKIPPPSHHASGGKNVPDKMRMHVANIRKGIYELTALFAEKHQLELAQRIAKIAGRRHRGGWWPVVGRRALRVEMERVDDCVAWYVYIEARCVWSV